MQIVAVQLLHGGLHVRVGGKVDDAGKEAKHKLVNQMQILSLQKTRAAITSERFSLIKVHIMPRKMVSSKQFHH